MDIVGVPHALAWTVAVRRTDGGMNDELELKGPSEVISTEDGPAFAVEAVVEDGAPGFFELCRAIRAIAESHFVLKSLPG